MCGTIHHCASSAGPFDPIGVHISSIIQNNCQIMFGTAFPFSLATALDDSDAATWTVHVVHRRRPLFTASAPTLAAAYTRLHRHVSHALAAHIRQHGFVPRTLDDDGDAAWVPEDPRDAVFVVRRKTAARRPPPPVDGYAPSPPPACAPGASVGRYSSKPESGLLLPPLPPLGSVIVSPRHEL